MSENYQYVECKHCGQSIMEGQIHSCKKMYLAEIDSLRKELNESVAIYENQCVEAEKTIAQLTNDKNAALSKAEFWRVSHDAACEDAKNWRRDAQELQGTLNDILADLQGRNIHLLSKHCWCEPTGHPWTQKGTVAE